jgi:hypothetical protein
LRFPLSRAVTSGVEVTNVNTDPALNDCRTPGRHIYPLLHVTLGGMAVKHRVGEYRRRMRERGLRPVQVWVPDVRTEAFAAEAHRQASIVAEADGDGDDQEFVESISTAWDEE